MSSYERILICADFSEDADIAFQRALAAAQKHNAMLHILHIAPPSYAHDKNKMPVIHPAADEISGAENAFMQEIRNRAEEVMWERYERKMGNYTKYEVNVEIGSPDIKIIQFAKKNKIDVIFMGALGRFEQHRLNRGNTVANVSKFAPCQVIIVKDPVKQYDFSTGKKA